MADNTSTDLFISVIVFVLLKKEADQFDLISLMSVIQQEILLYITSSSCSDG